PAVRRGPAAANVRAVRHRPTTDPQDLSDRAALDRPALMPAPPARSGDPRRRCGEAGAPSPLRFGAAEPDASIGRCWRRLIGAPTAPPPPRSAIRRPASAARLSPRAPTPRAGDGAAPAQAATAPGPNCAPAPGGPDPRPT